MSQGQYELRHESLNPKNIAGQFVVESGTGRMLAGVGHNPHRAWVGRSTRRAASTWSRSIHSITRSTTASSSASR